LWKEEGPVDRRFEVPTGNQKSRFGSEEEFERSLDREVTQNLQRGEVLERGFIWVCEPETGRNIIDEDELRSVEDLKDCQERRIEVPNCQEGNEMRSLQDLINCHEDSQGISHFQEGNESRLLWGLINCQEDSRKIPICQEGTGTEVRLSESLMNSEVRLDQ
jgi:hypothetical protein